MTGSSADEVGHQALAHLVISGLLHCTVLPRGTWKFVYTSGHLFQKQRKDEEEMLGVEVSLREGLW